MRKRHVVILDFKQKPHFFFLKQIPQGTVGANVLEELLVYPLPPFRTKITLNNTWYKLLFLPSPPPPLVRYHPEPHEPHVALFCQVHQQCGRCDQLCVLPQPLLGSGDQIWMALFYLFLRAFSGPLVHRLVRHELTTVLELQH